MRYKWIAPAALAMAVLMIMSFAGCDSEVEKLEKDKEADPFQVTATIPHHQQLNVPLSSGLIIHFSKHLHPGAIYRCILAIVFHGALPGPSGDARGVAD